MVTWLCWWQGAHQSDRGQGNRWSNLLTNTGPPRGPAAKQPAALRTPFSQGTFLLRCAGPSLQFHPRGLPVPSSCSAPSTASLPFQSPTQVFAFQGQGSVSLSCRQKSQEVSLLSHTLQIWICSVCVGAHMPEDCWGAVERQTWPGRRKIKNKAPPLTAWPLHPEVKSGCAGFRSLL